jgi:hypothetical protein
MRVKPDFKARLVSPEKHFPTLWLACMEFEFNIHISGADNGGEHRVYGQSRRMYYADGHSHAKQDLVYDFFHSEYTAWRGGEMRRREDYTADIAAKLFISLQEKEKLRKKVLMAKKLKTSDNRELTDNLNGSGNDSGAFTDTTSESSGESEEGSEMMRPTIEDDNFIDDSEAVFVAPPEKVSIYPRSQCIDYEAHVDEVNRSHRHGVRKYPLKLKLKATDGKWTTVKQHTSETLNENSTTHVEAESGALRTPLIEAESSSDSVAYKGKPPPEECVGLVFEYNEVNR